MSRRLRLALATGALLIAAGVVLAIVLPGPPHHAVGPGVPAAGTPRFGASVNRLFNDQTYSAAQIAAQLATLQATGATVARSDALWGAAQPFPPTGAPSYQWKFDDTLVDALTAHDLQWLPIIDYSAPWAESSPGHEHSPPRSDLQFAAFAAALAARYGEHGSFWTAHPELRPRPVDTFEIWNEPDNPGFWYPRPDAAAYARLYAAARAAITRADPSARVIIGGLSAARTFLPALINDLHGPIDGVAIHPYGPDPSGVAEGVRTARRVLRQLGRGTMPLYVTEFGWTTSPPGALDYAPAGRRPGYITQTLSLLGHSDCGIAEAILYTWVTPERHPAVDQDWFGISSPGATATAGTMSFAAGLRRAAAPGPVTLRC